MHVDNWKNTIRRRNSLRKAGGVYSWTSESSALGRIGRWKKIYHEWITRRRIKKRIEKNYKDLKLPFSLTAKGKPNLSFSKDLSLPLYLAAKKSPYFFSPREKVTKRALKPRLGLRRILVSLAKNPNSLREDRADFRPFVSAESIAEPYARLKKFNKLFSKTFLKRTVAVITVLVVLINVYVQNSEYSSGATFTFDQTQWRATPTGSNAAHPGDQSSFTDYTSKSANISLTGGAGPYDSATLSTTSDSEVQTVDADFNAGTTNQTTVASNSVALSPDPVRFGDGGDGAWTISSVKNINVDTNGNGGRTCADGISYNVTALTANTATLSGTPPAGCYSAGDQVMLLNEQGDGTNLTNVGNYEFLEVDSVSGNQITFTTNKTKYYGNGASDDLNIGLTANSTADSWTTFDPADSPVEITLSGSLVYPNSGDYIYSFGQGHWIDDDGWYLEPSNIFRAYSISNNNWTTFDPADAPAAVSLGADLVYPGSGDYIYAFRGNSTASFWAYSLTNNNWTTFDPADAPAAVFNGGSLVYPGSGDYIYAFQGNSTASFWAYALPKQRVVLQRVPQYTDVTIQSGGSLTANAWDGTKGGVLAFYASGTVDVQSGGKIDMDGLGYRGGEVMVSTNGYAGESYNAIGGDTGGRNLGGGEGLVPCYECDSSGGGGYGTIGGGFSGPYVEGGSTYGSSNLSKLFMGSGAGGTVLLGSKGGGIIFIISGTLSASDIISSKGQSDNGTTVSGGGSGGSIYIKGETITAGTSKIIATGGSGSTWSGAGGDGRIHLKSNSITGTTNPAADTSTLPTTYYSSGTFTSGAIDTGQNTYAWGNFTWNATLNGQTITVKARTDADGNFADATDWGSCSNITSGQALSTGGCVTNGHRYVQYQATLSGDTTATPSLDDVTIGYSYYPTSQTIVSSWYNTTDSANLLSKVIWDENSSMPSGTTIQFQAQTAPDSGGSPGTGTGFVGPDGTGGTYFSSTDENCSKPGGSQTVTCNVPASIQIGDGTDDQWISYKIYLNSDGANAPQLDSAKLQYVVNNTPAVTNVTATENSSGVLNIAYDVADSDNATQTISFGINTGITLADNPLTSGATTVNLSGNYSNLPTGTQTIQIDQEQMTCTMRSGAVLSTCTRAANNTRASTHTQNSIVWLVSTAGNVSGDAGAGIANGTGKSATWNIKADLSSVYYATATLRVLANDGQLANQMSLATGAISVGFVLDTKNPSGVSFTINNQTNQLTIATPSDNSSYEMLVSNASDCRCYPASLCISLYA